MSMPLQASRSLAAAAALALGGLAAAAAAGAAWPGLNGRIVVSQELPPGPTENPAGRTDQELVAWSPDGAQHQITVNQQLDKQPSFSPSGQELVFSSTRSGREQLYITGWGGDAENGRRMFVDPAGLFSSQPSFSPDARKVLFRSNVHTRSRRAELYTVDRDTGARARLTTTVEHDERYPTFSPDGSRIVFTSTRGGTTGVWVAQADGSDPRLLFDGPATACAPAWSPDGSRIAFETFSVEDVDGEIFVMDSDPATDDVPRPLAPSPAHDEGPAWSPDGTHIAFSSTRDGDQDTWIVPADGSSEPANFTADDRYTESPEWQPIPFERTDEVSCGTPFGPLTVVARCETATRVMGRWTAVARGEDVADDKVEGFAGCVSTGHSYDQSVVRCVHEGDRKKVAFVGRAGGDHPVVTRTDATDADESVSAEDAEAGG